MARSRKQIKRRLHSPDPLYGNRLLTRFINHMMRDGKKTVAERQVYKALELIKAQGLDPMKTFESAISKIGPKVEVRPRRVGGASYQVPTEVRGDRRISLAIRWIIEAAQKRSKDEYHTFAEKLAAELSDIMKNQGLALRKRDNIHKMAESNRAFAHFRW